MGHFTTEQISEGKDTLWSHCDTHIIGDKQVRKGSNARSAKDAHVSCILNAWAKLDRLDATPTVLINALSLQLIPRSHPEELHSISFADRLNRMEERMEQMMVLLDSTVAENSWLKERVQSMNCRPAFPYAYALKHTASTHVQRDEP